jgi:geranylgeranyl reductase family protein
VERADVLIVGGGPAGSTCAAVLASAGRDVLVVDAAVFPRDKPCGGWVTPEVLEEIPFSFDSYAKDHVAQPISRFRIGRIEGRAVEVDYGTPVSYGIRRSEFDDRLLHGSGARLVEGERVQTVERRDGAWVLNGAFTAPVLVGAGGHFCPIAHHVSEPADGRTVVVAREIEFLLSDDDAARCPIEQERPELYFCADLKGYGWCFRKENYLNIGLGRLDPARLPAHLDAFLDFLKRERGVESARGAGWRGHAYAVRHGRPRRVSGDAVVLVGDAAGLAAPASGEGILPALISGRLAAEAILEDRPEEYAARLDERLGRRASARRIPDRIAGLFGAALLAFPGVVRRLVLDRWFLHRSSS